MSSRDEFEKHIRENYSIALERGFLSLEDNGDNDYVHGEIDQWWKIWQAAKAWKKCSDELPEVGEYVLLKFDNYIIKEIFWLTDNSYFLSALRGDVVNTADIEWQYLPE